MRYSRHCHTGTRFQSHTATYAGESLKKVLEEKRVASQVSLASEGRRQKS